MADDTTDPAPDPSALPARGTHRDQDLRGVREEYSLGGLSEAEAGEDPVALLRQWMDDAVTADLFDPTSMVVTTLAADGTPSSRMVLCKGIEDSGAVVFYTNYESQKGSELAADPRCAVLFPWHPLQRQVRLVGLAAKVEQEMNDDYFANRPRPSQLGAWASPQSQPVESREALDALLEEVEERFGDDEDVPCPPHWGGFRVVPRTVEFWQGRKGRLHDRVVFERRTDGSWARSRLAP